MIFLVEPTTKCKINKPTKIYIQHKNCLHDFHVIFDFPNVYKQLQYQILEIWIHFSPRNSCGLSCHRNNNNIILLYYINSLVSETLMQVTRGYIVQSIVLQCVRCSDTCSMFTRIPRRVAVHHTTQSRKYYNNYIFCCIIYCYDSIVSARLCELVYKK